MVLRLVLTAFCLVLVVFLFGFVLDSEVDWKSPQIQQGAIAALVVISGWLVTFAFREGSVIIDRLDMSRDLLAALSAEIEDFRDTLALSERDAEQWVADLKKKTLAVPVTPGTEYHPFFSSIAPAIVADRFAGELRALPNGCVTPVVQFYATYADLKVMLEDMRDEKFRNLSADRRLLLYEDYIATRLQLGQCAQSALQSMERAQAHGMIGFVATIEGISIGRILGTRKHYD